MEAPTGYVYVCWLGEDYSKTVPEMLDASKVQGFDDEGFANVWTMGASHKGGSKAPTANKDKFLRSLAVAMAFAPEAKRVRMMANALEGMTEEELSDASQWDMYTAASVSGTAFLHAAPLATVREAIAIIVHCQAVDLAGIFVALVLVSTKVSR